MTDQQPEELRRDIARTRADMDQILAQIEDRVSPSRIKDRQVGKIRGRLGRTRDAVMGSANHGAAGASERASHMGERASGTAHEVADRAKESPERLEEMARGNPLAAGMIAFGVGAIAGSLLPNSAPERQLASGLRSELEEPIKSELKQAGDEVKSDLQEHAHQAVEETKQATKDAADRTTEEARGRAEEVRTEAQRAADHVQEQRS